MYNTMSSFTFQASDNSGTVWHDLVITADVSFRAELISRHLKKKETLLYMHFFVLLISPAQPLQKDMVCRSTSAFLF